MWAGPRTRTGQQKERGLTSEPKRQETKHTRLIALGALPRDVHKPRLGEEKTHGAEMHPPS